MRAGQFRGGLLTLGTVPRQSEDKVSPDWAPSSTTVASRLSSPLSWRALIDSRGIPRRPVLGGGISGGISPPARPPSRCFVAAPPCFRASVVPPLRLHQLHKFPELLLTHVRTMLYCTWAIGPTPAAMVAAGEFFDNRIPNAAPARVVRKCYHLLWIIFPGQWPPACATPVPAGTWRPARLGVASPDHNIPSSLRMQHSATHRNKIKYERKPLRDAQLPVVPADAPCNRSSISCPSVASTCLDATFTTLYTNPEAARHPPPNHSDSAWTVVGRRHRAC